MTGDIVAAFRRLIYIIVKLAIVAGILILVISLMPSDVVENVKKILPIPEIIEDEPTVEEIHLESISIVYSQDKWASNAADELAYLLSEDETIEIAKIKEGAYSSGGTSEIADLTIFLGHTAFSSDSYITAISRIGLNGYEIIPEKNSEHQIDKVYVTAFTENALNEAVQAFAKKFFGEDRVLKTSNIAETFFISHEDGELPTILKMDGYQTSLAIFAYPDTNEYSIKALSSLVEQYAPETVLINNATLLGNDRNTISNAWQTILSSLGSDNIKYINSIAFGDENGMASEVISTLAHNANVYTTDAKCIMIVDKDEKPLALDFLIPDIDKDDVEAVNAMIDKYSVLAERAKRGTVPAVLSYSKLPKAVADLLPAPGGYDTNNKYTISEPYDDYVDAIADSVYKKALGCGVRYFAFSCGYTNVGIFTTEYLGLDVYIGLCGSIGYDMPGVGGKFALNNSLRGMIFMSLNNFIPSSPTISMNYIYAAEHGLTVKNVGQ